MVSAVWFGTFAHASHDLWAASLLFLWITFLALVFCLGRCVDGRALRLPLLIPLSFFLVSVWLSCSHSYDLDTTVFEAWGWTFVVIAFYLFVNVTEKKEEGDTFFLWSGWVLLPLAAFCLWQQFTLQPLGFGHWEAHWDFLKPGLALAFRYGHWEIHATLINSIV